jgi:3-phytase
MQDEVYGLCMYKSRVTGKCYVFMNSKAGEVEQWELFENAGNVDAKLVRSFNLGTQTEGMVADDQFATVYIGEEVAGIMKFDAEPDGSNEGKMIANSSEENQNIKYDIEGLTIYDTGQGNGYLIASSQGNYSFAIFERQGENNYLGSFRIVDGEIDGVEETDGIDVTNVSLGEMFRDGIFVVQDGYNYEGKKLHSQNFKLVSWKPIKEIISNF